MDSGDLAVFFILCCAWIGLIIYMFITGEKSESFADDIRELFKDAGADTFFKKVRYVLLILIGLIAPVVCLYFIVTSPKFPDALLEIGIYGIIISAFILALEA